MRDSGRSLRSFVGLISKAVSWVLGALLFLTGVVGLPEGLHQIGDDAKWIGNHPVTAALLIWGLAHETALRWGFATVVLFLLWSGTRSGEMVRQALRYRIRRLKVTEESWVGYDEAIATIKSSEWARSRAPNAWMLPTFMQSEGDGLKYNRLIKLTLRSFEENNEEFVRSLGVAGKQYRQDKLIQFLDQAFEDDVIKKYGAAPSIRL